LARSETNNLPNIFSPQTYTH